MKTPSDTTQPATPNALARDPHQHAKDGPRPEPMMQWFTYAHLPPNLQGVSEPFCTLAREIAVMLPPNPERTVALRKLLEAKDCAVRALLYK